MLRWLLSVSLTAALVACADNGETAEKAAGDPLENSSSSQAAATDRASASASAGGAESVSESNDLYFFDYAYPAAAGNIPQLKALLDQRLQQQRKDLTASAIDGRADADKNGYPFRAYALNVGWEVVADLPDWLSLSAETYQFSGGAHGNTTFDTLLWDKRAATSRAPLSLFTSSAALESAVQPELCDMLDKQRAKKRGEKVVRDPDNWMNACIGLDSAVVILGSSNRRTFDRIGFLIAPYNAGPYAEGSYEVTLPVTAEVLAAVKPEFRGAFSAVR